MRIPNKKTQNKHYSPLRYPGGKTFLFPFFENVIENNGLKNVTYIEPYAGGAGAALALLFEKKVKKIVINDLDPAIYSFWKSAIFESKKFIKKLQRTPITIKEWKKQRNIYSNPKSVKLFDLGFATFFLNRTNISGILDGGPIGGLKQTGSYKMDARFNKATLIKRLEQLALHKDKITVFNKDGVKLIKDYLSRKNTFIYLDPPYFEKGAALYLNHYKKNDHKDLAEELNKNANAFWLLTYDNKNEIKKLYPERQIVNFSLNYNAYQSRIGKEVMIFSDSLVG